MYAKFITVGTNSLIVMCWIDQFTLEHLSIAALSQDSTLVGDHRETLSSAGIGLDNDAAYKQPRLSNPGPPLAFVHL